MYNWLRRIYSSIFQFRLPSCSVVLVYAYLRHPRLSNFECTDVVPSWQSLNYVVSLKLSEREIERCIPRHNKLGKLFLLFVVIFFVIFVRYFIFASSQLCMLCSALMCVCVCVNCVLHYLPLFPTLLPIRPLAQYQSVCVCVYGLACVFVVHIDRTDRGRMFSLFALFPLPILFAGLSILAGKFGRCTITTANLATSNQ